MKVELGWRGRGIALAALGAAVLGRSAFHALRTGGLGPIEMQALIYLALVEEQRVESQAGEEVGSLGRALACEGEDAAIAVDALVRYGLVADFDEDGRVAVTEDGVAVVEAWLELVASLFERWPPDVPGVDDATG